MTLTPAQAAARLQVSVATVRALLLAGGDDCAVLVALEEKP